MVGNVKELSSSFASTVYSKVLVHGYLNYELGIMLQHTLAQVRPPFWKENWTPVGVLMFRDQIYVSLAS